MPINGSRRPGRQTTNQSSPPPRLDRSKTDRLRGRKKINKRVTDASFNEEEKESVCHKGVIPYYMDVISVLHFRPLDRSRCTLFLLCRQHPPAQLPLTSGTDPALASFFRTYHDLPCSQHAFLFSLFLWPPLFPASQSQNPTNPKIPTVHP